MMNESPEPEIEPVIMPEMPDEIEPVPAEPPTSLDDALKMHVGRDEIVTADIPRPHPKNARRGNIPKIVASMRKTGFFGRLILQERSDDGTPGFIIAGEHRWRAWTDILKQPRVPVTWLNVSDSEAQRIRLIDNAANDDATYDFTILADVLSEMRFTPDGLEGTGFSNDDLNALIGAIDTGDTDGVTINGRSMAAEPGGIAGSAYTGEQGDTGGEFRDPNALPGSADAATQAMQAAGGESTIPPASSGAEIIRRTLAERFLLPPFTVLDARQGYWQARKRQWISLGIKSEVGRGGNLAGLPDENGETSGGGGGARAYNDHEWLAKNAERAGVKLIPGDTQEAQQQRADMQANLRDKGLLNISQQARSKYRAPNATPGGGLMPAMRKGANGEIVRGDGKGRPADSRTFGQDLMRGEHVVGGKKPDAEGITWTGMAASLDGYRVQNGERETSEISGTSIFDPVICELAYRWFCPENGSVLDPFAGGSVRGIVAACLGRNYTGIDLRPEQVYANEVQAKQIVPGFLPRWITGDSAGVQELAPGTYDMIFSCPPYADLERYSDNPADLSTMDYAEFVTAYRRIIAASVAMLKQNRFCCFVVGDIRDNKGFYRNFVSDTIAAFEACGARLYNEAILVTSVGSLPIRVGRQFAMNRKLGKTHQNCLFFYKGDVAGIREDFPPEIEFGDPEGVLNNDNDGDETETE